MSFHFVSHPWCVQEIEDGTLVRISVRDLDDATIAILVDDLFDLSLAEGRPNLYLDFQEIRVFPNSLTGQLIALDEKLREVGGRLVLQNVQPSTVKTLQKTDVLEMIGIGAANTP